MEIRLVFAMIDPQKGQMVVKAASAQKETGNYSIQKQ